MEQISARKITKISISVLFLADAGRFVYLCLVSWALLVLPGYLKIWKQKSQISNYNKNRIFWFKMDLSVIKTTDGLIKASQVVSFFVHFTQYLLIRNGGIQGPPTHIDAFQTNIFSWFNDTVI